jgi:tetrapyrrole methylase family protein/MazG family protein
VRPLPSGEARPLELLTDEELAGGDWLLAALPPLDNLASPHGMAAISARLRAPDGCPWDRRQTHDSLRPFVLEEAYETVDAIERGAPADLAEELGDLFLQVILHAQLSAEEGEFDLTDVYRTLGAKIVRRHPHVFGDVEVADAAEVLRNWETIKAGERAEAGASSSPFAGIARALPALPASREIQERASSLGWDWPAIEGVWEKVGEELDELHAAGAGGDEARDAQLHELGDVLDATVNLARWLKLDPVEALRTANRRWIERYERVERLAAERGQVLADLSAEGKDALWNEVKAAPA